MKEFHKMKSFILLLVIVSASICCSRNVFAEENDQDNNINSPTTSSTNIPTTQTPPSTPPPTTTTTSTTTPKPNKNANKKKDSKSLGANDCPANCTCLDKRLSCRDSKLREIPNLSKTSFIDIDLSNNSIGLLDFNLLPIASMEILNLSLNNIKTLVFNKKPSDSIPKLKTLNLNSNKLVDLNTFSSIKLPILENLDLSLNSIEDLPATAFNNSVKIQILKLYKTNLKTIHENAFLPLNELKLLNLTSTRLNNHLGDRQFIKNQKLETVDLTDNNLIEVPFSLRSTSSIRRLILNQNFMSSLRQSDFINRVALNHLEISFCPNLSNIDEATFGDLTNLTNLIISNNPKLTHISKNLFKSSSGNMREFSINTIDLRYNNITTMSNLSNELVNMKFDELLLEGNPWDCGCDLKWLVSISNRSPVHCKSPKQYKDMEIGNFFQIYDCDSEQQDDIDSRYNNFLLAVILLLLFGLTIAVFIHKNESCRRLLWKDQYGTIYYTKASFPTETV